MKCFAEFNGNCESCCSPEQLIASLCAVFEGKPATGAYYPKTKGSARSYLQVCCVVRGTLLGLE